MPFKPQIRLFEHDLLRDYDADANQVIRQACHIRDLVEMISGDLLDYPDLEIVQIFDSVLDYLQADARYFADAVSGRTKFDIQHFVCNVHRFTTWYNRLSDLARHTQRSKMLVETGYTFYILEVNCRALELLLDAVIRQYLLKYPDTNIRSFPYDWSNVPFLPAEPKLNIDFDPKHYIP